VKQTFRYDQVSCRLQVEGLPDVSAGHADGSIGIVSGWTLNWAGRPALEGRKEHLVALMQSVLPYARLLLSGVARRVGQPPAPVEIAPSPDGGHTLLLRSSQPDTEPLSLRLDDAELADLVRVLDQVRLDPRLRLPWDVPQPRPLRAREVLDRRPLPQRLAAPVGGVIAVGLAAGLAWMLPPPRPQPPAPAPAPPSASAPQPGS
jgi:hypothetical protein